jgi:putative endonuclease
MEYFTYVLQSQKDSRLYFGQTHNLEKRLGYHKSGKSTYTKSFAPWDIIAYKTSSSRKDAVNFEKKLKNLKSLERVKQFIISHNFTKLKEI